LRQPGIIFKEEKMTVANRGSLAVALLLILLGVWFLLVQFVPGLQAFTLNQNTWPLVISAFGIAFGVAGVITWKPDFFVPASLFVGLGGLLYYQNLTGDWKSWAYAWTLIPGFVGIGVFISSVLQGKIREAITAGGWLVVISLFLFFIFGSFLGGINLLGVYWPILLIILGFIGLTRAFVGR
jgi:hypothetical protein